MAKQRRQLIDQIFMDALDVAPSQRSSFVAHACRDNPELQPLVEALLLEEKSAGSFLERPLLQCVGDIEQSSSAVGERFLSVSDLIDPMNSSEPRFKPGETLSDRFVVVRFIAQGGMGEVYEVEDSFLQGTHVALKTILPHAATNPAMQRRFEHEVLLARKVTHANLCPIYDIFHCKEPAPSFSFLTMKLLSGETLAAKLMRSDALPADEAMTICTEMMSGIAAIHAAGVIHGDIKPNNVIVEGLGTTLHIWITDFGLARLHESAVSIASNSMRAGTPGYLAPELLTGHSPSQASDIFALGVLIHETFTGEKPNTFDSVAARLRAKGASPEFAQIVSDFLAEDPQRRCNAFAQAQRFLDPRSRTTATRRWQWLAIVSIVILAILVGIALRGKLGNHAASPPMSVIVTEFENRTENSAFDQTPRELISAALSQSPQVSVFPLSQIPDVLRMMQMPETAAVNEQVGDEICTREGLQSVIAGSISKLGGSYLLLVRVLNCNGDSITSTEKTFSGPEQLPATIDDIAAKIRHKWGESRAAIRQASQPLALVTSSSLEAVKLYSSGKQQLYLGNFARAANLFKSAVDIDDNFAMAHEYLAIAYVHSADYDRAGKEFARAVRLSDRVTEKEREKILADSALFKYDIPKAMSHYQTLAALSPDDPAVHMNLAECYRDDFRFDLAISEANKAVAISPSTSFKTTLATDYFLNGDTQHAIQLAEQVLKENPESVKALNLIGESYLAMGQEGQAQGVWAKMLSLGGTAATMARASLADAAQTRENLKEAATQLEYAVNADAETGNTYDRSREQISLADVYSASGNQTALAKSLRDLPEPSIPELIYFLGRVYARSGRISGAEKQLRELEAITDKTARVSSYIYMLQSEVATMQNRSQDAIREATLAVQHHNSPLSIETLARAYDAAGSQEQAAQQYETLLARANQRQFDSADSPALHAVANARYRLGVLYQSLQRDDLAEKEFKSFLDYAAEQQDAGPTYQDAARRLDQLRRNTIAAENPRQLHTARTP